MPSISLTSAQRIEKRKADKQKKIRESIMDAVSAYKNRNFRNNKKLGKHWGISHQAVAALLDGGRVSLDLDTLIRILDDVNMSIEEGKQ